MVRFEDVWLRYQHLAGRNAVETTVLRGVGFEIPDGGFRWLTGPSGAGKTSLLKLIYLAEHPSRGRIDIMDTHAGRLSRRDAGLLGRRIGGVYPVFPLVRH